MDELTERELRLLVTDLAQGHVRSVPEEWLPEIRSQLSLAAELDGSISVQAEELLRRLDESGQALLGDLSTDLSGAPWDRVYMDWTEVILSILEAGQLRSGPVLVVTAGDVYRHPDCPPTRGRDPVPEPMVDPSGRPYAWVAIEDLLNASREFTTYLTERILDIHTLDVSAVPLHRFPQLIQEHSPTTVAFLDPRWGELPGEEGSGLPDEDAAFLAEVRSDLQESLAASEDPYQEMGQVPSHLAALTAVIHSLRGGQQLLIPYSERDEFWGVQNEFLRHLFLLRCDALNLIGLPSEFVDAVISAHMGREAMRFRGGQASSWTDFLLRVRPAMSSPKIPAEDGTENGISWFGADLSMRFLPWLPDWLTAEGRPLFRGFERFGHWTTLRKVVTPHYLFTPDALEAEVDPSNQPVASIRTVDQPFVEAVVGLRPRQPDMGPKWVSVGNVARLQEQADWGFLADAFLVSSRHGCCPMPDELAASHAAEDMIDFYVLRPREELPGGLRAWIRDYLDSFFAREWIRLMEGRSEFNGVEDILSLPFPYPDKRQLQAYQQLLSAEEAAQDLANDLEHERKTIWGAGAESAEWTRLVSVAVKSSATLQLIGDQQRGNPAVQATAPFPIAWGLRQVASEFGSPEDVIEEVCWLGENVGALLLALTGIVLAPTEGTPHPLLVWMQPKLTTGMTFGDLRQAVGGKIPSLLKSEATGFLELIDWVEVNQRLDPIHKLRNVVAHGRGPTDAGSELEVLKAQLAELIRSVEPICLAQLLAVEESRHDPVSGRCLWAEGRVLRGDHPLGWPVRYEDVNQVVHGGSLYLRTPNGKFFPASPFLATNPENRDELGVLDMWDGETATMRSLLRRNSWESQTVSEHLTHLLGE